VDPRIWWRYPPFMREAWARRAMVMFWVVLLIQAGIASAIYIVAQEQRAQTTAALAESRESTAQLPPEPVNTTTLQKPYWIDEPHETESGMRARAAAGDHPAVILVDGTAKAFIPAGDEMSISLPRSMGARSWTLQAADLHRETERWTWSENGREGLSQVPGARGIAITFDGGWRADHADEILRTLRENDRQATFFLTGQFLKNHPDTARRIVAAGHEVANHTWSHPHLTTFADNNRHQTREEFDRQRLQWELLRTEQLFHRITGQSMAPMWRAPYGEINEEIEQWARELGYTHVGWTARGGRDRSLDTLDWVSDPDHPLFVSGEDMARQVIRLANSPDFTGGIVLMHLGGQERPDPVHGHLGSMIRQLRKDGIPTVTVGELLRNDHATAPE